MRIEFTPDKDAGNRNKHGVSLAFRTEVLADTGGLNIIDVRFDYAEERFLPTAWRKTESGSAYSPWAVKSTTSLAREKPTSAKHDVTGLSQNAFARRFGIPAGSLRDWEQGRRAPDAAAKSYLRVIARIPAAIAESLHDAT